MDGWWNTTAEFKRFIQLYGGQASSFWIYALRNPLILEKWDDGQTVRGLRQEMKTVWASESAGKGFLLPEGDCDVLMYCSSNKPSVQPAMSWLARRLGHIGISTVHWGPTSIDCYAGCLTDLSFGSRETLKGISRELGFSAVCDIPASFCHSARTYAKALVKFKPFARRFERAPSRLFWEIAKSRHLIRVFREILVRLKPKCILTNGEQTPVGCALTAAARKEGIHVIWFFNEWPTLQIMPIMSDELWVWNESVRRTLKGIQLPELPSPQIKIIGMAQLDCMEQQRIHGGVTPVPLPGPRCLVFLSEHIPAYSRHNELATQMALQWLAQAAEKARDWNFVIKPRPYHDTVPLPGEHYLIDHPNITVLRHGVSMASLLATQEVKAFAALSSSGLLLGAATGRMALRFLVSDRTYPLPPLDDVVQRIKSPEVLVKVLNAPSSEKFLNAFPHRGKVLETMEDIICQRLSHKLDMVQNEALV